MKFLIAILLLTIASPALAAQKYTACAKAKNFQTKYVFDLQIPDPQYDLSKSRRQLNKGQKESHEAWLRKNGMESVWSAAEMETLGQAAGGWGLMSEIRSSAVPYDRYGTSYCPYIAVVDLRMAYRTIISIPNNFKPGGCMFNHIHEHELRHHTTNVQVVRELVARLQKDLPVIVSEIEKSTSYIPRNQAERRLKAMQEDLKEAIKLYMSYSLRNEMNKRNSLIDTPQEYARSGVLMAECDGK